jgi:hypothetical protein
MRRMLTWTSVRSRRRQAAGCRFPSGSHSASSATGSSSTWDTGCSSRVRSPTRDAPTVQTVLISWVFLLALLPLAVKVVSSETVSSQIATVLALISLIPTTTLIAYNPQYTGPYVLLIFIYWFLFLLACLFMPAVRLFRRPWRSELPHVIALAVLSAAILYVSWQFTGFRLHFGLFDVYDLRAEARGYRAAAFLGYLATMADNTLPVLLGYYLRRRWLLVACLVATVILFNYGVSATKQVLFLLVFALASVTIRDGTRINGKILMALTAVVLLGLVELFVAGSVFVGILSIYRVFMLPAHLHWIHFDFFQTNELLFLTQSALRFFFESPYKDNIQFLLGEFHIGDITARANNGLFSDAYMNFGALGVFFYPILAVFLLKLVDGATEGLATSVRFVLTVALSFVFLGLPLPTAILTAGTGFLIILLSTLPRTPCGSSHAPMV